MWNLIYKAYVVLVLTLLALTLLFKLTDDVVEFNKENMYQYKAKIVKVYDGDTVTAEIDLGFNVKLTEKLRLYGINAPELRGEEKEQGKISRDILKDWILMKDVVIHTMKDKKGKYGRYLAEIFVDDENINQKLIDEGYAVEYMKKK